MNPWFKTIPNLWIGLSERAYRDEFDYVVSIGDEPTPTSDGLRHRQFPVPGTVGEAKVLLDHAVAAIQDRWMAGKSVLVTSSDGAWAEVVCAAVLIHLGSGADEAILQLQRTRPGAVSDPQHRSLLWTWRDANA